MLTLTYPLAHPNLQPRYLGRSHSQADYKSLEAAIPGQPYRPPHETPPTSRPTEEAQTHFTCLLEYATEINRSRQSRRSAKIARLNDRLQKAQDWRKGFEQAERTFGLRAVALSAHGGFGSGQGNQWQANQARWATEEASRNPPPVHPLRPVPHPFDSEPVLIAVDVEAYERAPSRITEIGISTLDTRDLKGVAPGWFGAHWCPYIRSRHVRIIENAHLENSQFVTGCANDFRFGVSEMVHEAVIQEYIATFFRPPFSKLAEQQKASTFTVSPVEDISDDEERRTIVLVGHSFDNDLRYLRGICSAYSHVPFLHISCFPRHYLYLSSSTIFSRAPFFVALFIPFG